MTRVERLQAQLDKLLALRKDSLRRNDFVNLSRCNVKIQEVEKCLEQAKMYEPVLLSEILDGKGEDVKNQIYKLLIECSLAADYVNDCAECAKEELLKHGIYDFHFREDLVQLCRLSQKVASVVLVKDNDLLNDALTDDAEYVDTCHAAANKHLKERLNL